MKLHLRPAIILAFLSISTSMNAQCVADTNNIYSFTYNGTDYEVVKENKTWVDAAACAVERGGILAEINDQAEQTAVYNEVLNNAGINAANTVAPDGGGASYVWIGGNDFSTEGRWVWDGNDDSVGPQFWQGTSTGVPIGGLYNNWGNEPDDFGTGQDTLGLAITDWPLGTSGQWNDVNDGNTLYFVIEIPNTAGVQESSLEQTIDISPVPFTKEMTIQIPEGTEAELIQILNVKGQVELTGTSLTMNTESLSNGVYFVHVHLTNGTTIVKKVIK